jgi:hypothetical protein
MIKASASFSEAVAIFYDNKSQNLKTETTSSYLSFVSRFKKTSLQFETGQTVRKLPRWIND